MDKHPLDDFLENEEAKKEFQKRVIQDTSLILSVFNTEHGKKLLERWKDVLMYSPTATPGMDQLTIGMNEGYKSFVRTIIQSIKEHEKNL